MRECIYHGFEHKDSSNGSWRVNKHHSRRYSDPKSQGKEGNHEN